MPDVKEDYQKQARTKLKRIRARITMLEIRAGKAEADIAVRYDQKLHHIRGQYTQAKDNLEKLGKARQDGWLDSKKELERSIDILSEAVDQVARQISV